MAALARLRQSDDTPKARVEMSLGIASRRSGAAALPEAPCGVCSAVASRLRLDRRPQLPARRDMPLDQPRLTRIQRTRAVELRYHMHRDFLAPKRWRAIPAAGRSHWLSPRPRCSPILSGGLVWMMSGPEAAARSAVGPNSPLELVSLSHARQNEKLAVSGLVRNPVAGEPDRTLSAVVFLFDRMGTFVTSSRANVDFFKLGAGDESPFVVSIDAPPTVARYRVSFRTDEGVVPHIDRRGESPAAAAGDSRVKCQSQVRTASQWSTRHIIIAAISASPRRRDCPRVRHGRRRRTAGRVPVQERRRADQRHGHRHRSVGPLLRPPDARTTSSSTRTTSWSKSRTSAPTARRSASALSSTRAAAWRVRSGPRR